MRRPPASHFLVSSYGVLEPAGSIRPATFSLEARSARTSDTQTRSLERNNWAPLDEFGSLSVEACQKRPSSARTSATPAQLSIIANTATVRADLVTFLSRAQRDISNRRRQF